MSDQQMNEAPLSQEGGAAPQSQALPLPGAVLAEQRQRRGWTIEQAASLVKLAPRQVHAIETDNYAALPGMAVARGFVRSYAKALGLDADAVIAGMPKDSPVTQRDQIVPQRSLSTPFSEGPLPAMMLADRGGTSPVTLVIGALVLALMAGAAAVHWTTLGNDTPQLAWLKPHGAEAEGAAARPASESGTETSTEIPVNARVETVEPAAAGNATGTTAPATSTTSTTSAAPTSAPVTATAIVPATPSASVPAAASSARTTPVTPGAPGATPSTAASSAVPTNAHAVNNPGQLRLTLREDSWVEIRRADKTTIISRLLKAGTTESFDVADAAVLVVGNAAGVDATLRDKPLELKSTSGNNVARLPLN